MHYDLGPLLDVTTKHYIGHMVTFLRTVITREIFSNCLIRAIGKALLVQVC